MLTGVVRVRPFDGRGKDGRGANGSVGHRRGMMVASHQRQMAGEESERQQAAEHERVHAPPATLAPYRRPHHHPAPLYRNVTIWPGGSDDIS